jgi:hypothetical protein
MNYAYHYIHYFNLKKYTYCLFTLSYMPIKYQYTNIFQYMYNGTINYSIIIILAQVLGLIVI